MEVKAILSCPLGHKCEEVRDNAISRCAWFIELAGRNPNTGEEKNERGCAMSWIPVLLIETAGSSRSTTAAIETFRNEVVKDNLDRKLAEQNFLNYQQFQKNRILTSSEAQITT